MPDRTLDPWGARTPYARGGDWPIRVDEHTQGPVERWVQSACVLCSHGCALDVGVREGRIVGVRGRGVDRVNHGRLGPKGLYGWQANNAEDRLLHPLVRRNGELRPASWDEAMDLVVARSRELLTTKGSGALGFYTSGQLFLEDYYTLALIARGGIGTNHLDGNTRLCTATAGQSLKETFGCDGQPNGVHDIEFCDSILHVGINTAETQTVLWMHELDRLRGPDPPRTVVIDPRKTESAREAQVHLAIKPGTNLAVLNGLAQQLIANDRVDRAFVDLHTIGFDALEKTVSTYSPERVAEICGVAADDVRRAISRIAHEIVERDRDLSALAIVGIRARGDILATRTRDAIATHENTQLPLGSLDITLYRDDLTRIGYAPVVHESALDFSVDDKVVVLVDDVLFTGRTIRAAMDALVDYGRPRAIRLAVLVDRGHRELPIRADFVGKNVPTKAADDVRVHLVEVDGRDEVELVAREAITA